MIAGRARYLTLLSLSSSAMHGCDIPYRLLHVLAGPSSHALTVQFSEMRRIRSCGSSRKLPPEAHDWMPHCCLKKLLAKTLALRLAPTEDHSTGATHVSKGSEVRKYPLPLVELQAL